ncbi:hypothetical protein N0V82_006634 [Gnomoniopsis sp. IMI 355080]|nr:hypothetical protein N0V82_006634 [Gnomoniopsis sp. IMI 355080]
MYYSFLLSFALVPMLGLAIPTASTGDGNQHPAAGSQARSHILKRNAASNSTVNTKEFDTVNYFPNPEVHCSGRSLDDSGDTNWSSDLDTAVTATSTDGLYGSCNVYDNSVDGYGSLAWSSGTVQVYYCNHGFSATSCDVNEYWRADALIDDSCGSDGGGWVTISDWSLTIGRDPTNEDGSFRSECGDSLHGVNENYVVVNATVSR